MPSLFKKLDWKDIDAKYFPMLYEYVSADYKADFPLESPDYDAVLSPLRMDFINQLTPDQISDVTVVDIWKEDHEACLAANITFISGDVLSVAASCIIPELVGAFYFGECDRAKQLIIEYLISQLLY